MHGRSLQMKVKKVFCGGGMIVCPQQRAKSLMSFHHERIHYARQGSVALNVQERIQDASKGRCIFLHL